mgnify:CR=1 FL=1
MPSRLVGERDYRRCVGAPAAVNAETRAGGAPLLRRKVLQSQQGELPLLARRVDCDTNAGAWELQLLGKRKNNSKTKTQTHKQGELHSRSVGWKGDRMTYR